MTEEEARELVESEGFTVIELLEYADGSYCFLCNVDGGEVEVCVVDGLVTVAPT